MTATSELLDAGADAWAARNARRDAREVRTAAIVAEASQVRLGHALLTAVTGLFFWAAWLAGKAFRLSLVAVALPYASVKSGWNDSLGRGPSKADLLEQNHAMRLALQRMGGDVPPPARMPRGAPR